MCRYVVQALYANAVRIKEMNMTFIQQLLPKDDNCFEESGLDVHNPCDHDPCDYKEASLVKCCSAKMIVQSPQQRLSGLS